MKQTSSSPIPPPIPANKGWLERLGLIGLGSIEAPLLAALVTESPLLLIGVHGTAKSQLLTRVASALGLVFRHYNASLLNFDDLVGFPLPGKDGKLEYIKTPASIWGAGAVIFDEISRCRPDIQNKLFPIIHERRVQGLLLEGLRFRWAAMNPPTTDEDENGYAGSEPLDAALADRFAFVVEMPRWENFTPEQQLAIIRADDTPVRAEDAAYLNDLLGRTRQVSGSLEEPFRQDVSEYVRIVIALLAQAGIALSPRRANILFRSILAVTAASLAIDPNTDIPEVIFLALRSSLPQRAQGLPIAEIKILGAHREAIRSLRLSEDDPLRAILCSRSPLERFQLAIRATKLSRINFSSVTADALAQLQLGAREAAIVHLFETGAVGRLNAAVAAHAAESYQQIAVVPEFSEPLAASSTRFVTWSRLKDLLSKLDPDDPRAQLHANALASLFVRRKLQTPAEAEQAFAAFAEADTLLRAS